MDYISKNTLQTKQLAHKVAAQLTGGEVLCLYGELGAGKTVFVAGLIDFFLPGKRVLSPTFIIVRHYLLVHPLIKNIYHVDLYRMEKPEEIMELGLTEFIDNPDTVVLIEWAEKLGQLLPRRRIDVSFTAINESQRLIKIRR